MTSTRKTFQTKTAITLIAFSAPAVSGGIFQVFDDRPSWTNAAGNPVVTEGFEGRNTPGPIGFPSVFNSGLGLSVTGQAATHSAIESGDPFFQDLQNTTPGGENYARFGIGETQGDYTVRFLLPETTSAFGFDIIDWEPGRITSGFQGANVELRNNAQVVLGFDLASALNDNGGVAFIGFVSDTFVWDEIRFTVNEFEQPVTGVTALDVTGIDEVAWAVPAPGTAGAVVVALGMTRRRNR